MVFHPLEEQNLPSLISKLPGLTGTEEISIAKYGCFSSFPSTSRKNKKKTLIFSASSNITSNYSPLNVSCLTFHLLQIFNIIYPKAIVVCGDSM